LIELCVPLIAILLLQRLFDEREQLKEQKKKFLIVSGVFFVFLFAVKVVGLGDNYTSRAESERVQQMPAQVMQQISEMDPQVLASNYGLNVNDPQQLKQFVDAQVQQSTEQYELMKGARADIFNASMTRSLFFAFLAIVAVGLLFYTSLPTAWVIGGLAVLVLIDLVPVDLNYLNASEDDRGNMKYWVPSAMTDYPLAPEKTDLQILEMESMNPAVKKAVAKAERDGAKLASDLEYTGSDKRRVVDAERFSALNMATNYRVFDLNGAWSSSRASYFHKSLGGYHGAKLRNIQNLFDFHISRMNNKVMDMLNVKYFIQGESVRPNPTAMGNAWFVSKLKIKNTPDDEIRALGNTFVLKNTGSGIFFVNGERSEGETVYGSEKLQYVIQGKDTMEVPLSNGISKGTTALWVMDANGKTNLIPEMTLAADSASSFQKLIEIQVVDEFKPDSEGVMLASEASKLKKRSFTGVGAISLKSYAPNKLVYQAECKGDQLAVFSEIYYPEGWTAKVDGKEVPILKVNYLLRGVEVPTGKHKVEFTFDLPAFHKSNSFAFAGTLLLVLLICFGFWKFPPFVRSSTDLPQKK
jgi:hypothetical protein